MTLVVQIVPIFLLFRSTRMIFLEDAIRFKRYLLGLTG